MSLDTVMSEVVSLDWSMNGTQMSIQWNDTDSYNSAKSSWDWVNVESGRYIAMVVNATDCRGYRRPYKVATCNGTESDLSMTMTAQPVAWQDAYPFMNMSLSTTGLQESEQNLSCN